MSWAVPIKPGLIGSCLTCETPVLDVCGECQSRKRLDTYRERMLIVEERREDGTTNPTHQGSRMGVAFCAACAAIFDSLTLEEVAAVGPALLDNVWRGAVIRGEPQDVVALFRRFVVIGKDPG